MTGRPEAEFQREIPRLFGEDNCKLLSKEAVNADIRSYVDHELHQRPGFTEKEIPNNILDQIRSRVGDGADGMFRWAACQLDSLAECLNAYDTQQALDNLPGDLNETYRRMLHSIPPKLERAAFRLLRFLVHAKRPLTVSEAVEVIATLIDKEPPEFNKGCRLYRDDDILRYCPSLISIAEVTRGKATIWEVQLAHFSVQEYLVNRSEFNTEMASIAITRTCFTYIKGIGCSFPTMRSTFPLARYAAEIATEHARLAESSHEAFDDTASFFQEMTTFKRWAYLYQPDMPREDEPGFPKARCLYYTCLCGLLRVSRFLLNDGADVNAQGGEYGNALCAASEGGHQEIVQLLLNQGADVNAQGYYGNALQAASKGGYQEIVQLLLNQGANVNGRGGEYGNALYAASKGGHQEIVQLLLNQGADINAQGGKYGNALCAASEGGHQGIVQLLINQGVDINAQGGYYGNALQAASSRGYQEIVQLLINQGADINAQGGYYGNALHAASEGGYQEIVQLLLDQGADMSNHWQNSDTRGSNMSMEDSNQSWKHF